MWVGEACARCCLRQPLLLEVGGTPCPAPNPLRTMMRRYSFIKNLVWLRRRWERPEAPGGGSRGRNFPGGSKPGIPSLPVIVTHSNIIFVSLRTTGGRGGRLPVHPRWTKGRGFGEGWARASRQGHVPQSFRGFHQHVKIHCDYIMGALRPIKCPMW